MHLLFLPKVFWLERAFDEDEISRALYSLGDEKAPSLKWLLQTI